MNIYIRAALHKKLHRRSSFTIIRSNEDLVILVIRISILIYSNERSFEREYQRRTIGETSRTIELFFFPQLSPSTRTFWSPCLEARRKCHAQRNSLKRVPLLSTRVSVTRGTLTKRSNHASKPCLRAKPRKSCPVSGA